MAKRTWLDFWFGASEANSSVAEGVEPLTAWEWAIAREIYRLTPGTDGSWFTWQRPPTATKIMSEVVPPRVAALYIKLNYQPLAEFLQLEFQRLRDNDGEMRRLFCCSQSSYQPCFDANSLILRNWFSEFVNFCGGISQKVAKNLATAEKLRADIGGITKLIAEQTAEEQKYVARLKELAP